MRRGRPDKMTPQVLERVVQAIGCGATYELAALFAGVRRETISRWMKKGEGQQTGKFREFADAVQAAEGRTAVQALATIRSAAKDSWQASAWLLERRYPEQFGRQRVDVKTESKVEHQYTGPAPLDLTKLTDEEIEALERIYKRQEAEQSQAPPAAPAAADGGEGAP